MYGFMFKALERLVKTRFGDHSWKAIVDDLDLDIDEDGFKLHQIYPDVLLHKLIASAVPILSKERPDMSLNPEYLLELFGESFFNWTIEYRYDNLLKILGNSLVDFLTNLDALHDHLGTAYTGMRAPSFRCTEGEKGVIFLHYYSVREGLYPIVIGIVKAVAHQVYHYKSIDMVVIPDTEDLPDILRTVSDAESTTSSSAMLSCASTNGDESIMTTVKPVVFRITVRNDEPDHPGPPSAQDRRRKLSQWNSVEDVRTAEQSLISPELICRAFPFHIVFDRGMLILQMGASLQRLVYRDHRDPVHMDQIFEVVRPRMPFSFNLIVNHINGVFILRTKRRALRSSVSGSVRLKGQMLYDHTMNVMLFLCSPRIGSMTQLKRSGLYLSDIPIHDATRDLILQAQTSVSAFRLMQQMEVLVDNLKKTQGDLQREKNLTDRLLYSILPESAANALRQGKAVPVENFDSTTILFSDIKGFTKICGRAQPLQVVRMLHEIYMRFDQLVAAHGVYKVETIGDAYMVVGGLPETCENHAQRIARQALDMMVEARKVLSPDSQEPLEIRVGIHSGGVMAGVVGQRMPRYCLFGNTVNIASRTESTGEAGMIHITQATHVLIKNCREFGFEKRWPMVQMKGVNPDIQTYFLLEQRPHEKRVSVENYPELSENSFFEEPDIASVPVDHFMCRMCESEVNAPVEGADDPDMVDDDDDDDDDDGGAMSPPSVNAPPLEGRNSGRPSPMVIHRTHATPLEQDQVVTAVLLDRRKSEDGQGGAARAPAAPAAVCRMRCPFTGAGMMFGAGAGARAAPVQPEQPTKPEDRVRKNARPAVAVPVAVAGAVHAEDNVFRRANTRAMAEMPAFSHFTSSQLMERKLSRELRSLDLAQLLEVEQAPRAIPIRLRRRESALYQLIRTYSHENVSRPRHPSSGEKREMKIVDVHTDHNGNPSTSTPLVLVRPLSPSLSMPCLVEYEDDQFLMYFNHSRRCSAGCSHCSRRRLSSSDSGKSPADTCTVAASAVDGHTAMLKHFKPQESSTPRSSVVSSAVRPPPAVAGSLGAVHSAPSPCPADAATVGATAGATTVATVGATTAATAGATTVATVGATTAATAGAITVATVGATTAATVGTTTAATVGATTAATAGATTVATAGATTAATAGATNVATAGAGDAAVAAPHAVRCSPLSVCDDCAASPAYVAEKRAQVRFSRAATAAVLAKTGGAVAAAGEDGALPAGVDATLASTADAAGTLTAGSDATTATTTDATLTTIKAVTTVTADATMTMDSSLATSAAATLISRTDPPVVAGPDATAAVASKDAVAVISADAIASDTNTATDTNTAKNAVAGTSSVDSTVLPSTDAAAVASTDGIGAATNEDSAGATDDAATASADTSAPSSTDEVAVTCTDAVAAAGTDSTPAADASTSEAASAHSIAPASTGALVAGAESTAATSADSAQAASKSSSVAGSTDSTTAVCTSATVTASIESTLANPGECC